MQTLDLPWTEKYRPSSLSEVIGQETIVNRLKAFVKNKNFPNMIFAGPAGIGKTTCAVAMANDLYNRELVGAFKEMNASVTPDTPVLARRAGKIERTTIGRLADVYFSDDSSKYIYPEDLEVLSLERATLKVGFLPVKNISRHRTEKIRKIKFEGGSVKTTADHSVMVLDDTGRPKSVKAGDLKQGDLLVSFKSIVKGEGNTTLDVSEFAPNEFVTFKRGKKLVKFKNPKIRDVIKEVEVDDDMAWFFGSYMAEGVTGFHNNTSGVSVLTYAYPKEYPFAERSASVVSRLGFTTGMHTIVSGSSHMESAIQMAASSTQLARFFRANFYLQDAASKTARYKKVPSFVFELPVEMRHEFLKGYSGDAAGEWSDVLRYSSISEDLLVDTTWLARISGLESSIFNRECRIIWDKPSSFYLRTEIVAIEPFIRFLESLDAGFNWRYELRHSLYYKKSKRAEKELILSILKRLDTARLSEKKLEQLRYLKLLAGSALSSPPVVNVEDLDYDGYVYDFSVPESEMFWGGTAPILLHNSDERGIDVIRGDVKEFAKTISIADVPIKIIFLDEADSLTSDAQHALRRTMERFSAQTRFILNANYASKIIEPIQSRCIVFRFKSLNEQNMRDYIKRIEKGEGLGVEEKAVDALIYVSDGDMRKLTNVLQSCALQDTKITEADVYNVAAKARPKEIASMLKAALSGSFAVAKNDLDALLIRHGMNAEDVLLQCYKEIQGMNVDERKKLKAISVFGETNFRIVEGANEHIQMEAMLANLALI